MVSRERRRVPSLRDSATKKRDLLLSKIEIRRLLVAVAPLALVTLSLRWRDLDKFRSNYSLLTWLVDLLLTTLIAIPTFEVVVQRLRRRRAERKLHDYWQGFATGGNLESLVENIGHTNNQSSALAVVADDSAISHYAASIAAAYSKSGFIPIPLTSFDLCSISEEQDVAVAFVQIRHALARVFALAGLRDEEAFELWDHLTAQPRAVLIFQVESTFNIADEKTFCSSARNRLSVLHRFGFRPVMVGVSNVASMVNQPTLIDTTAEYWARAYLPRTIKSSAIRTDHDGARFLLEILASHLQNRPSARDVLEMIGRLWQSAGPQCEDERVDAAGQLLSSRIWTDHPDHQWLLETLSTHSRGIDVVAAATNKFGLATPIANTDPPSIAHGSSFIAVKRFLVLATDVTSRIETLSLINRLSRTQRLNTIRAMGGPSSRNLTLLAYIATDSDVFTRFAAATQFSLTTSNDIDPNLQLLLDEWLSTPSNNGMDNDYCIGALGWILPSLTVRFPLPYQGIWSSSIQIASARDPSHLQLSLARGLGLVASSHPEATLRLVKQLAESDIGFWLTEVKLVHAAGLAAHAMGLANHEVIAAGLVSRHELVREAADIVNEGLLEKASPATWTWGFESFEMRATAWPQPARVRMLMARVGLAAGLYWNSLSRNTFNEVSFQNRSSAGAPLCVTEDNFALSILEGKCYERCPHRMCTHAGSLTELSNNDAESGKGEFGVAFCLDQLQLAKASTREVNANRLWFELAAANVKQGRL